MPDAGVIVVGGGPGGLAAAACLGRRGLHAVVLEADSELGARWAGRYDGLRLHTVRRLSGLPHHPLPRRLGRYVGKDEYAAYLREYAERLALDVRLESRVRSIRPGWEVETEQDIWRSRAVVVATGRHDVPSLPDWPGREAYRGRLMPAADFRSAAEFRDRDVLVVGLGNSGAEIAVSLAGAGARVSVAVRSVPPIAQREILGVPVQILGLLCAPLPPRVVDAAAARLRPRSALGPAAWGPFTARKPPVIDTGFLRLLREGDVAVRPAVRALTVAGAMFADGTDADFDAIVAATGYDAGPLVGVPGVHLVGMRESVRGGLLELSLDARRVARDVAAAQRRQKTAP